LTDAQANLFAAHGLSAQAEQAFRLSLQICPYATGAVLGYVGLLTGQNRTDDALAVARSAAKADPSSQALQSLLIDTRMLSSQSTNLFQDGTPVFCFLLSQFQLSGLIVWPKTPLTTKPGTPACPPASSRTTPALWSSSALDCAELRTMEK